MAFGIIGLIVGAMVCIDSQSYIDKCENYWFRYANQSDCNLASEQYDQGLMGVVIGIVLLIPAIILIAVGQSKPVPQYSQFTCPRCRATLTYQYSPTNCYNCGLPIDWDKAKAPQK
ncbi:MAG: hypothetical protein ACXAEN_20355 [Candidatus Thorarchaeota archaeon]